MSSVDAFAAAEARWLGRCGLEAGSRFVRVPAVSGRVHVLVSGDGPPVCMVPGFADPTAMWAPLMARLDGFTCHAVDRPNFGLSGRAVQRTATLRTLAVDFLEQVLDALELERPLIVANSMGSLWSMWLALDRPQRVAAMVHVGCPAFLLGTSAPAVMRVLSVPLLGRLLMTLAPPSRRQVEGFARMVGEDLSQVPELVELLVVAQKLPGVAEALVELLHAVLRLRGPRPGIALDRGQLVRIQQPTLLVWGGRDVFGGVDVGREAATLMPDADLHLVPEGGHIAWVAHPDAVAEIALPFLRRHAAAASGSGMDASGGLA